MAELLDLCYDVLIHILEEVNPEDLGACAQTSWGFNNFIKKNTRLYKAHYLRHFDDPRSKPSDPEPDWVSELQKIVKCQKILQSDSMDIKRANFNFAASTIENLIHTASLHLGESLNRAELIKLLENSKNLDAFLYRSSYYERAGTDSQTPVDNEDDQQLSARLHCLFGIPDSTLGRRVLSTHTYARSKVYDLRNYTDKTKWGPFRDDGSMKVDWEMIEALMIDLEYNANTCCRRYMPMFRTPWSEPFGGIIQNRDKIKSAYLSTLPMEPDIPLEWKDPYSVTGLWSRIVCFLDYNDLYHFNFGTESMRIPSTEPRQPIETEEAIRHIRMSLSVTAVHAPGQFDNPSLPVVHFTGKSRSIDVSWDPNANSKIKGTVSLTPEGEVRWTTVSIFYDGEERWRSEGIQVGGRNSKRGVIGTWFDKDYDPHGPAGPTAFWKVSEERSSDGKEDEESESDDEEW